MYDDSFVGETGENADDDELRALVLVEMEIGPRRLPAFVVVRIGGGDVASGWSRPVELLDLLIRAAVAAWWW